MSPAPASARSGRRSRAGHDGSPAGERPPRTWRSIPWWPVGITVLVLLTALVASDPVRDAATLAPLGEARLSQPPSYLAIEPISSVLDTLTLLTVAQHVAILVWVIALFAWWRVARARTRAASATHEVLVAVELLIAILIVYAAAAVLPRPMAQLTASDDEVIAIDFHAHTKYSHDGRSGWSEDDVRRWHHAAGFDVAYVTDHATFEGAERGLASDPGQAGEGTVLLQGLEAFYHGEHVNLLGAGRRYRGITSPDLKDVDDQALMLSSLLVQTSPIVIETIPGKLDKITPAPAEGGAGVRAIEIVDGSPKGLAQGRRDRSRIVHMADSLNLALVVGTDNHGWGRAAPGWTLMRMPGWRGMTPDSLSSHIESALRVGRRRSTRPVERRVADGSGPLGVIFALPAVVWEMFATLGADERVMWLIWAWGVFVVARVWRSYRARSLGPV